MRWAIIIGKLLVCAPAASRKYPIRNCNLSLRSDVVLLNASCSLAWSHCEPLVFCSALLLARRAWPELFVPYAATLWTILVCQSRADRICTPGMSDSLPREHVTPRPLHRQWRQEMTLFARSAPEETFSYMYNMCNMLQCFFGVCVCVCSCTQCMNIVIFPTWVIHES